MKKLILAVTALAVAVIGFGGLRASTTYANPAKVFVVNQNVLNTLEGAACGGPCDITTAAGRAKFSAALDTVQTASGGQVAQTAAIAAFSGPTLIFVQTDGSGTNVTLNGRGLLCAPLCDATTPSVPDATDHFVVYTVTDAGTHNVGDSVTATASQDGVTLDSSAMTVVGQAHDMQLSAIADKTTIQEGAATCAITDSFTSPTRAGVLTTFTDINGTALVGYKASFSSSSANMKVAIPADVSMVLAGGAATAAFDVVCGVNAGTATLSSANVDAGAVAGVQGQVTRTLAFTITGVPASVVLTANPPSIACDGSATSTVTAKVTDSAGNDVVDGTPVTFQVLALGTANPIQTTTTGGSASSTITPFSGAAAGVTVLVTAGTVQASTLVSCTVPTPTVPAPPPGATATPTRAGVIGPGLGTGGYAGQAGSAGFPMWTLVVLALGSVALVAGGVVARRAAK